MSNAKTQSKLKQVDPIQQRVTIKQWAEDDRPREKLLGKGTIALSNAELLAILIGSGTQTESALELAQKLLNSTSNSLTLLGQLTIEQLKMVKGIGDAKAVAIVSAIELGRRREAEPKTERIQISSSKDIYKIYGPKLGDLPHEEFHILILNRANQFISSEKIGQGGLSGTVADIRVMMKIAIEKQASSMVVCHNHPSGQLKPSKEDIEITQKIKEATLIFGITLLDHLIITTKDYYSFADEGLL